MTFLNILIAPDKREYPHIFSYFSTETYVVDTHKNSTHNYVFVEKKRKKKTSTFWLKKKTTKKQQPYVEFQHVFVEK